MAKYTTKRILFWHPKMGPIVEDGETRENPTSFDELSAIIRQWYNENRERKPVFRLED